MAEVIRVGTVMPAESGRRLVPRVYAPRPGTAPAILKARLRKALTTGADPETLRKAASALTHDERGEVLEDLRKAFWNPTTKRFDAPRPVERYNQTLDAPKPKPTGPTIFPPQGTGFLRAVRVGDIIHADIDGERHHFKILKHGKAGVTGVNQRGDIAAIAWADVKPGVAPESQDEHEELVRRRDQTAVRKSMETGLYALTPEERVAFFAERDGR
jgi:hypothetical protein